MRLIPLIACLTLATLAGGYPVSGRSAPELIETRAVSIASHIQPGDKIGRIRFLGMLELPDIKRDGARLSQLSGLAWDDDDGVLYAVSDRGFLFHFIPEFDGDILARIRLSKTVTLNDPVKNTPTKRKYVDTEGLDVLNARNGRRGDTELIVSFERVPLIARYSIDGRVLRTERLPAALNDISQYQSPNKMLESVCVDPALNVLTTPELPLKNEDDGFTRIFSVSGTEWRYPLSTDERITAMECLGHGDIILLQSHYASAFNRIVITLNRVHLTAAPDKNTPLRPVTLARFDSQDDMLIDNFEGLARHRGMRFFMVSDNNDLFFQRTLLMYFEILDP